MFLFPPKQLDRPFLKDGYLPVFDWANRCCAKCGQNAVDEPNTNKGIVQKREQKMKSWRDKVARYKECKKNGVPFVLSTGNVLKSKPRQEPTLDEAYYLCHCLQIGCNNSTGKVLVEACPIQCIDPLTKERYGIDEDGNCLCPLDNCSCSSSYVMKVRVILFECFRFILKLSQTCNHFIQFPDFCSLGHTSSMAAG